MNYSNYKITLDVRETSSQLYLSTKQGDTMRRLIVTLTEGGRPYKIEDNVTAVFTAEKADKNIIFNDCRIEEGTIVYDFTAQTTAAVGRMPCEIRLYAEDNKLLTSARFTIAVEEAVYSDGKVIESMTEVSTLTRLITEATALITEVNEKLDKGEFVPSISIGNVETLVPGTPAYVSISGSHTAPIINFGVPQGFQGEQGIQGVQGIEGPKGDRGESGIIVPTVGFYTLSVDENGDLWLTTADEEDIRFEYDSETGNLYYITED